MKTLITNYSFSAASKQITLLDFTSLEKERLLLITNVTDNIILYNFANPLAGGTIAGNIITLTYDTTGMSDGDDLQIYYDSANVSPATDEMLSLMSEQLTTLQEQNLLMRRLLKLNESNATVDPSMRQRITIGGSDITSATVMGRVYPVDQQGNFIGGMNLNSFSFINALPEGWKLMDAARVNFQQSIRSNLKFS